MPASSPNSAATMEMWPSGSPMVWRRAEARTRSRSGAKRLGDAAADDDEFGADEIDHARQAEAEKGRGAVDFLDGHQVAGRGGGGEFLALEPGVLVRKGVL